MNANVSGAIMVSLLFAAIAVEVYVFLAKLHADRPELGPRSPC
jgi:hypothetical protein